MEIKCVFCQRVFICIRLFEAPLSELDCSRLFATGTTYPSRTVSYR